MVGNKYKCTKFCMSKGKEVIILDETEDEVKYKIVKEADMDHFMPGKLEHTVNKDKFLEYYSKIES